jgi:hypothetical protein
MRTLTAHQLEFSPERREGHGPPVWLFAATAVLGIVVLAMALAETNLWLHYLIDGGEYVSLVGLVFIAAAGVALHRAHRLVASLPLVGPWLLFPLITQGDQIIDNVSIVPMRIITHVLLAAIFATPVGVIVLAARSALLSRRVPARPPLLALVPGMRPLAEGRAREGTAMLAASLLVCEMWMAIQYLGALMVGTLILMVLAVLWWGSLSPSRGTARAPLGRARSERSALILLLVGVAVSFGLYIGYKNRPGAYQGSPSFLMDPHQHNSGYRIDRIPVPTGPMTLPASTDPLHAAFTGYGLTLRRMLDGYYILDRNYTWHFHNELFLRHTPLVPDYRAVGLQKIAEARALKMEADRNAAAARALLADDNPIATLLDDVQAYVAFNFDRAARIESMSAEFEKSAAGLQHAAHLYEGEGKVLGMVLSDILMKHRKALESPGATAFTGDFTTQARDIFEAYATRVVGF